MTLSDSGISSTVSFSIMPIISVLEAQILAMYAALGSCFPLNLPFITLDIIAGSTVSFIADMVLCIKPSNFKNAPGACTIKLFTAVIVAVSQ